MSCRAFCSSIQWYEDPSPQASEGCSSASSELPGPMALNEKNADAVRRLPCCVRNFSLRIPVVLGVVSRSRNPSLYPLEKVGRSRVRLRAMLTRWSSKRSVVASIVIFRARAIGHTAEKTTIGLSDLPARSVMADRRSLVAVLTD